MGRSRREATIVGGASRLCAPGSMLYPSSGVDSAAIRPLEASVLRRSAPRPRVRPPRRRRVRRSLFTRTQLHGPRPPPVRLPDSRRRRTTRGPAGGCPSGTTTSPVAARCCRTRTRARSILSARCSRARPFPTAMRLFPVLHWVLAGWGMLALLRALGASAAAAWVAREPMPSPAFSSPRSSTCRSQAGAALQPWALWALVRPAPASGARPWASASYMD